MKKRYIAALMAVVLFAVTGAVLMATSMGREAGPAAVGVSTEPEIGNPPAEKADMDLEDGLNRFAEVIYTYDTRERRFYEGARSYMTEQGFQMLVPFSAVEEEEEEEEHPAAVVSSLNDVSYYYRFLDENNVQVMMEADFTLSRSGNGKILQYTKLFLEKTGSGWKIDAYEPVDTIER